MAADRSTAGDRPGERPVDRRRGSAVFGPARALMSRLSYTRKILVVVLVTALPLGYTMTMYLQAQGGQVDFARQEHLGVDYLVRVSGLEEQVVAARHAVVTGQAIEEAPLDTALDAVAAVDDRLGDALSTHDAWRTARTAVATARSAGGGTVGAAHDAWTAAAEAVVALASAASDGSNLTLDPDLDSYYVMDAVAFRFPLLIEDLNELPDALSVAVTGGAATAAGLDAARLQASAALGSIASTLDAVSTGMAKSFASTADAHLLTEKAAVRTTVDAVSGAAGTIHDAVAAGRIAGGGADDVATASSSVLALWAALLPDLDTLLSARMDRFTASERLAVEITIACALLAAYLVVGFFLSAVPPMRRMRDALAAIRDGNLRARVPVSTRDEIGEMGAALNDTAAALAAAVERIDASAREVAEASTETSSLAGDIAAGAGSVHTQVASSVLGVAGVTEHATAVATAGEQMSASIREISAGATEAAATASRAVIVTRGTGELVGRLRESCAAVRQVVGLISDVSDQTHLLALNASIEAARAGAAGDGFGVVAQEVRDLARESASAAEDIARRVDTIEADSTAAVEALADIEEVIGQVNEIQSTIATAVNQQDAALAVLGRDVASVASAAAEINSGMGHVESAADDSEQRAQEVHRVAARLEGSAAALREAVERFAV